jgi:hypothetical protein
MEWIKTPYPGIRYRIHPARNHGIHPDKYYCLTYKYKGKTRTEALGWASEGMTNVARKLELLGGTNPLLEVEKPKFDNQKQRFLTREETEVLMDT